MTKPRNIFRSLIVFVLLNSVVINAYSISISTRRLYLDPKSNSTFIRVHNMDSGMQSCEVKVNDIVINNIGNIELITNGEVTKNSAKPLIRLAPRRFTIEPNEYQMVKLLYRRKPGLKNGEYQGVLAIKCTEQIENSNLPVTIVPALVHNVPVIVRTGRLPLQAEFVSTRINGNKLQVELKIQGQRSLSGKVTVINSASGEVVSERNHVSIYSQQPVKKLEFSLGEYKNELLLIRFTENTKFGGDLVIEQPIK